MVGLFSFLLVASGVALVVALVLLVVRAVKKKPKKPAAVMAAACAAVFLVSFVGIGVTYHPTPEQLAERERIAAEKAAEKEERERAAAEEAARKEAEKAAQSESPASAPVESQPPEPSASVPASAPSESSAKPETSAPAESESPAQSEPPAEPPTESEPPVQDFVLDFNSLTPDDFGALDTGNLKLEFGELLEVRYGGDVYAGKGVIIVKAKIEPNLTNNLTIRQNYHDVCDLITNHGFDSCPEIQYWAVADLTDGREGKVISFTLDSATILGVANQTILPLNLDDYLQDLWILPSLLE